MLLVLGAFSFTGAGATTTEPTEGATPLEPTDVVQAFGAVAAMLQAMRLEIKALADYQTGEPCDSGLGWFDSSRLRRPYRWSHLDACAPVFLPAATHLEDG